MAETTIRYGVSSKPSEESDRTTSAPTLAARCPECGRNFSQDAEFCPYDGERLEPQEFQTLANDNLIGAIIDDRYEVLSVIGEGGMGRVYRVRHRRLGRAFALKALRLELSEDPVLTQRFVQEARAAAVVIHPNVVQINDFGTLPKGQPYFVMELLEGRTLTRILRERGPLEPRRCIAVARQIAEALGAAHAMGVIHRDLKPDNVIVIRPGGAHIAVKVLDFGLAKVAVNSRLTRPGVVFGTPHYMSPEQAAGEPYDHRVDVYALGIIMFEMVTGRVPFEADTYMGVLSKHLYAAPPRPREFHGSAGTIPELEEVIAHCLEKKPDDRWPSMTDLARKLAGLSSQLEGESRPATLMQNHPTSAGQGQRTSQRLNLYALAVSVYVSCGVALVGLAIASAHAPRQPVAANAASTTSNTAIALGMSSSSHDLSDSPKPERPLPVPPIAESSPVAEPSRAGPAPGRAPPVAKRGKTEIKPGKKNKKNPLPGSGDLADPWAK